MNSNYSSILQINNSVIFDNEMHLESGKKNDGCYSRKPIYKWVCDSAVVNCYNCKKDFGYRLRKHHCRICGRIFCYYCSNNFKEIPNYISKPLKKVNLKETIVTYLQSSKLDKYLYNSKLERLCDSCNKLIDNYDYMDFVILSAFRFLDLDDVRQTSKVSTQFKRISLQYQAILRGIQYKFFTQNLTGNEYDYLISNKKSFSGHSSWVFHLIKSEYEGILEIITQPKTIECEKLLCKTGCKNYLEPIEILQLLYGSKINTQIKKYLLQQLQLISDTELMCFVPIFIELIKRKDQEIIKFVIEKFNDTIHFYHAIMWELVRNKINLSFDEDHMETTYKYYLNVFYSLQNLNYYTTNNYQSIIKSAFMTVKDLTMLGKEEKFIGISYNDIKLLKSKTQPIVIPFILENENKKIVRRYIFKRDEIYQDYIITKVIRLMTYLLKIDNIIKTDYINYDIILLTKSSGFIEFVDDSQTLYHLVENEKDILNYVLHNNKDKQVDSIIHNLTESLAIYSVISYLLGIGDRHLNNIMVHKNGHIFHVDFGFILGNDPKFSNNYIRLSMDMVNAIGGKNSDNYNLFKSKCSKIFNCLRKHIGIISLLLSILTINDNSSITPEKLTNELIERFEPGEQILDASDHIKAIIDNSHDNITSNITDTLYRFTNIFR